MAEKPVPATENADPLIRPWDRFNQELVAQVRPLDWTNPKPAQRYNLVVIGAGTAGLVSAAGAAGLAPPGWARRSRWSSGT